MRNRRKTTAIRVLNYTAAENDAFSAGDLAFASHSCMTGNHASRAPVIGTDGQPTLTGKSSESIVATEAKGVVRVMAAGTDPLRGHHWVQAETASQEEAEAFLGEWVAQQAKPAVVEAPAAAVEEHPEAVAAAALAKEFGGIGDCDVECITVSLCPDRLSRCRDRHTATEAAVNLIHSALEDCVVSFVGVCVDADSWDATTVSVDFPGIDRGDYYDAEELKEARAEQREAKKACRALVRKLVSAAVKAVVKMDPVDEFWRAEDDQSDPEYEDEEGEEDSEEAMDDTAPADPLPPSNGGSTRPLQDSSQAIARIEHALAMGCLEAHLAGLGWQWRSSHRETECADGNLRSSFHVLVDGAWRGGALDRVAQVTIATQAGCAEFEVHAAGALGGRSVTHWSVGDACQHLDGLRWQLEHDGERALGSQCPSVALRHALEAAGYRVRPSTRRARDNSFEFELAIGRGHLLTARVNLRPAGATYDVDLTKLGDDGWSAASLGMRSLSEAVEQCVQLQAPPAPAWA